MSGRYYDETEETLKKLDQRRSVLDKKTALRIAYIAEFNIVKAENRVKLQSLVQAQNIKAKERNAKLLQEVSAASIAAVNHSMDIYKSPFGVDSAKNSQKSDKLAEAKREYYKSIEVMLPQYKHDSIKAHEVEIMRIKAEKRVVDERRSKLQQEFEKEEIVKGYLEQERRALSLSLGIFYYYSLHSSSFSFSIFPSFFATYLHIIFSVTLFLSHRCNYNPRMYALSQPATAISFPLYFWNIPILIIVLSFYHVTYINLLIIALFFNNFLLYFVSSVFVQHVFDVFSTCKNIILKLFHRCIFSNYWYYIMHCF